MESPLPGLTPMLLEHLTAFECNPDRTQSHDTPSPPPDYHPGYLQLICGPMFSGKTTLLAGWFHKVSRVAGVPCLVVNHSADQRYTHSSDICTHDGTRVPSHMLRTLKECEMLEGYSTARVILINEIQFFGPECIQWVQRACEEHGKMIICFGLDGTFQRKPFGDWLSQLMPLCDSVTKLHAVCTKCKRRSAPFSMRLDHTNQEVVCVGGSETYAARCRKCWLAESQ